MGKSSLFNRILGRRAAVVSDREGVTRDRHYQTATYKGREFTVVDTGGFLPDDTIDVLAANVRDQIFTAIQEADLVLFMVDARVGITKLDDQFARMIRKLDKQCLLIANKSEAGNFSRSAWVNRVRSARSPATPVFRFWTKSFRFSPKKVSPKKKKSVRFALPFLDVQMRASLPC